MYESIKSAIRNEKARSAWEKGVMLYALEIIETIEERAEYEGRKPYNETELKDYALNGAQDWDQASWGGSYLIYNGDIAERLCNASELKKTRNGERKPNANEEWLDTQARALYQAWVYITRNYQGELYEGLTDGATIAEIVTGVNTDIATA